MERIKIFLSMLLVTIGVVANAQGLTVTGVVKDSATDEPIPFASVHVQGTMNGCNTDSYGTFTLKASSNSVLVFSCVGYQTTEVEVRGRNTIDVFLASEALDEVVMIAYGSAKKSSFTGSATAIKSESLKKRSVTSVTKAIEGMVPGVTAATSSGQPGDGASIIIRGIGSINANSSPLYVVDGIPYDGSLSAINPSDIESLTVLKDASASALYGSRGANGVVMITTKRGTEGRTNVNFKAEVGFESRAYRPYKVVDQKEYVQLAYEALRNANIQDGGMTWDAASEAARQKLSSTLGGEQYNPFKNYTWDTLINPETGLIRDDAVSAYNESWLDAITNSKALRQEYTFGLNGGNDKTKYTLSLGILDEDGILVNTNFNRYSFRTGVDHKVNDWLAAGANTSYAMTRSNAQRIGQDSFTSNVWYTAQFMAPIYPVYLKDENGKNAGGYDYGESGRPTAKDFNSLGDRYLNKYETIKDNASIRAYTILGGDSDIMGVMKGLSFSSNFGADVVNSRISAYSSPDHGDGKTQQGTIDKFSKRDFSWTWNQILKYEREFDDKHHVLGQVGHEFYRYRYNHLEAGKTKVYPGIEELAPAVNLDNANSYQIDYKIESYFGRLAYDFADRYYFEGTWRTDGSSRFHKDYRWGQFWSLGASWRLSEEKFMKNVSWIDNMTLRLSYGQLGNDGLESYYAWQSFYDLTVPNAKNPGALVSSLENTEISWEKKGTWNAGIESTMFNHFLSFSVEYYHSLTSDMLLEYPMALSTGFSGYDANVGSMKNQGFEASFRFNWIDKNKFGASSSLMLYRNWNKVIALTNSDTITKGAQVIKVGMPIRTYYMPKSAGVDPATGIQLYWAYKKDADGNKIEGSDYRTTSVSEANTSRYYFGSREPKLQGSFGSEFRFGPVDFSFLTTFSIGGKVYDSLYASTMDVQYVGTTWNKNALRRWQKPGDITDVPAVKFNSGNLSTDAYLIDASYFAIKSLQIGYTLPAKWAKAVKMHSLRIYATADNLAMFNKLPGMNVQYNFTGGSNYTYTPMRVIAFGVDVNF